MARTKVVAMLLGPSGIGLVSLYQTLTTLTGTVAGLGVSSSGVREIADACASEDPERIAKSAKTLARLSWITGLLGWVLTALLAYPLSQWTFGSGQNALSVAILGLSLVLTNVAGGQSALIQGTRRIGDLARLQIFSMVVSTIVSIAIYAWLKEKGILPVLIVSAAISVAGSWWYSSKIPIKEVKLTWNETWKNSQRLVALGIAFMWSALLGALVAFATRSIITKDLGIEANGIYQSAWAISVMFAQFILSAMGTDFYPRLTASSHEDSVVNKLVNEQTEIAILLALPGLVGTMIFAPVLMNLFYSSKFIEGASILPWLVLGVFFKVISWPMGFIQLAKGATRWFIASESLFSLLNFIITIYFLKKTGLVGAGQAFAISYGIYIFTMLIISTRLSGFYWSKKTLNLLILSSIIIIISLIVDKYTESITNYLSGAVLTLASIKICLKELIARIGKSNRMVAQLLRIPFVAYILGIK